MRLFIDTNVVLDLLMKREGFYEPAVRLFDLIAKDGHAAFVSAISFNNVYYIARKSVGDLLARGIVRDLRQLCRTVPLTNEIIDGGASPADLRF